MHLLKNACRSHCSLNEPFITSLRHCRIARKTTTSDKVRKIHKKTTAPESTFTKVAGCKIAA